MGHVIFHPGIVARLHELTGNEVKILGGVCSFFGSDGSGWPSQRTVAALVGLSKNTVRRGLDRIVALGFLVVERRDKRQSNVYRWAPPYRVGLAVGFTAIAPGGSAMTDPPRATDGATAIDPPRATDGATAIDPPSPNAPAVAPHTRYIARQGPAGGGSTAEAPEGALTPRAAKQASSGPPATPRAREATHPPLASGPVPAASSPGSRARAFGPCEPTLDLGAGGGNRQTQASVEPTLDLGADGTPGQTHATLLDPVRMGLLLELASRSGFRLDDLTRNRLQARAREPGEEERRMLASGACKGWRESLILGLLLKARDMARAPRKAALKGNRAFFLSLILDRDYKPGMEHLSEADKLLEAELARLARLREEEEARASAPRFLDAFAAERERLKAEGQNTAFFDEVLQRKASG